MSNFKLPKWVVAIAAAAVFLPLAVDWAQPGEEARLAAEWLGGAGREGTARTVFPLWRWLVVFAGRDVAALGWVSVGAGIFCVWLVAAIAEAIFGAAIRGAKTGGANGEEGNCAWVESAAVLVAGLGFAFTPGFLAAATRISPLMVALVPWLMAAALVTGMSASRGDDAVGTIDRLKKGKWRLLLAVGLVGYSAVELTAARRVFLALAFPAAWVWLAVGVMPALVIAWCVRKRWGGATDEADSPNDTCKTLRWSFAAWGTAVAAMGGVAVLSVKLNEGRVASQIVARIIANAEEDGKVAVVSDGDLDELFFLMLPERIKLISLAREREPEYGRELSEWVRECLVPSANKEESSLAALSTRHQALSTDQVEDLAFAADLGPRALVAEWEKIDMAGFEAKVATVANWFPARAKWDAARAELDGTALGDTDSTGRYLRHLMAVCGNALGCRMLEDACRGGHDSTGEREQDAWAVFKAIVDEVEPTNYAAYLNLLGMAQRGFAAPKDEVDDFTKRRRQLEKDLKSRERILCAARSGGRLYAAPEGVAEYEKAKRKEAKRELSPAVKALLETVAAEPKDPEKGRAAQEAIHKAISEGKVRADRVGKHLVTLDLALGDMENAEKDAIEVLRLDRHEPTANAALGSLAGSRGDHERAERYLRRAIATGKASASAKNDLARTLMKLGRLDEAEPLAREAVKAFGESWTFRETLAAILIRKGRIEEGERELQATEKLLAKSDVPRGKIVSIEIDRARLLKAKGEHKRLRLAMRKLKARRDLTDEQQNEVKGLKW